MTCFLQVFQNIHTWVYLTPSPQWLGDFFPVRGSLSRASITSVSSFQVSLIERWVLFRATLKPQRSVLKARRRVTLEFSIHYSSTDSSSPRRGPWIGMEGPRRAERDGLCGRRRERVTLIFPLSSEKRETSIALILTAFISLWAHLKFPLFTTKSQAKPLFTMTVWHWAPPPRTHTSEDHVEDYY